MKMLHAEMVFPLLSAGSALPEEKMPLAGVLAPSRMSHVLIVLSSFPFTPVVVLKTTVPLLALVFTPCSVRWRSVFTLASLMKRTALPLVLELAMVRRFAVPAPPGRPSRMTNFAPFKSTVAAVVSALVRTIGEATALSGRMVTVFAALAPARLGMTSGKVSTV